jgi:hypothetical protein
MYERLRYYAALPDAELLAAVEALVGKDRTITVEIVASLAEVEMRRLYLGLGYSSLYVYCAQHLRLSEHAAYTRMEAARAVIRFPIVLDMLASGDLSLTNIALLGPWLTEENHLALLEAARHKTKRQVQAQIAELNPRAELDTEIIPLSGGRYRLEMTLNEDAYRMLQRLRELMRHSIPSGDPAEIVPRALKLLLVHVERQKLADTRRPRRGLRVSATRYVPAEVRRQVLTRDQGQCAFIGAAGRCPERTFLELHHVTPFAAGGLATADNLQLRCRAHNLYEAEPSAGHA